MKPEDKDRAYLWDMQLASRDILEFVQGMEFSQFEADKKCRFAVERQLLVIGEAAHHLSPDLLERCPQIPWSGIIGLRNIIAHDYGEILTERIWVVTQKNIPALLVEIDKLLSP